MATTTTTPIPHGLADGEWFSVGLASSYPNITASTSREPYFKLAWPQPCPKDPSSEQKTAGCRIFHPKSNTTTAGGAGTAEEIGVDAAPGEDAWHMREQVVVFRYEGRFHAVDHACPHRAWSLAWAQPFDIEDAGRGGAVVGRGLRCRGHGYAFELTTGAGDRGAYRLGIWDVELRPCAGGGVVVGGEGEGEEEREVWVRRRKKSG